MKFRTCDKCGSNLDYGERCNCDTEAAANVPPVEREQILQAAVQAWGEVAQTDMCIEEMSELTKALLKIRRLPADAMGSEEHCRRFDAVREEIADVQIMLDQMRLYYGDTADVEADKLERLKGRLPALAQL